MIETKENNKNKETDIIDNGNNNNDNNIGQNIDKRTKFRRIRLRIYYSLIIVLIAILVFFIYGFKDYYNEQLSSEELDELGIAGYNKLMIVAHPDDETLWGGAHLSEGGYLVVCFSHGDKDDPRSKEFFKAVQTGDNVALILKYPDKINGKRSDWNLIEKQMTSDIKTITDYKDWELIATHNPDGEYGHAHHIAMSKFVTNVCREEAYLNLYYFGKYYSNKKLKAMNADEREALDTITEEQLKFKEEALKAYSSQDKTVKKLSHMNIYENWTKCE